MTSCIVCGSGLQIGTFTNLSGEIVKTARCRGSCGWRVQAFFRDWRAYVACRLDVVLRDLR